MAKTGILRNAKEKKAFKAHEEFMELENIIEEMGNAMRSAYLPYIAEADRFTPNMDFQLRRFRWHAMKVCGIRKER